MTVPNFSTKKAGRPTTPTKPKRVRPIQHDETPSGVTNHAFEPKGAWYTLCKHCNLAESAHAETTTTRESRKFLVRYYSDDNPED